MRKDISDAILEKVRVYHQLSMGKQKVKVVSWTQIE